MAFKLELPQGDFERLVETEQDLNDLEEALKDFESVNLGMPGLVQELERLKAQRAVLLKYASNGDEINNIEEE